MSPRKKPPPDRRLLLLLFAFTLLALALIGVREGWVSYHREHREMARDCTASACTSDSDCPKPQCCVDKVCCLPAVSTDGVRWNFGFR